MTVKYHAVLEIELREVDGQKLFRRVHDVIEVSDCGLIQALDDVWVAPLEVAGPVAVSALRREFRRYSKHYDTDFYDMRLMLSDVAAEVFDAELAPVDDKVTLNFDADSVVIKIIAEIQDDLTADFENVEDGVSVALASLLSRLHVELHSIEYLGMAGRGATFFELQVIPRWQGRTVQELYELGGSVLAYLEALRGGGLTARQVVDLVGDGHAVALLGQEECAWIDVKSGPYLIRSSDSKPLAGKIELAQDIARFANGGEDAVIVIGMGTRISSSKHEEISSLKPVSLERISVKQYLSSIDSRIFPPVEGLRTAVTPYGVSGGLMTVFIPRQPEELKPFLVHGAIVSDRIEGAFISIVQRRGDDSITTSPAGIHSMLAAGRALLRRGEIPER